MRYTNMLIVIIIILLLLLLLLLSVIVHKCLQPIIVSSSATISRLNAVFSKQYHQHL